MGIQRARPKIPLRRRPGFPNTVLFPRELRDAIPDLPTCIGRVLDLTAVDGSNPELGPPVSLRLLVQETGKLTGEFTVSVGLQVEAARALAAMLTKLADQADA
jgi:hypothetical protein